MVAKKKPIKLIKRTDINPSAAKIRGIWHNKTIGKFGAKMPDSTEICSYCKHYHSRNLPGGWSESGCTKHGWKSDSQGGTGKRLGESYKECKGNDFEYIQRQKRLKPIPKPEWVE